MRSLINEGGTVSFFVRKLFYFSFINKKGSSLALKNVDFAEIFGSSFFHNEAYMVVIFLKNKKVNILLI